MIADNQDLVLMGDFVCREQLDHAVKYLINGLHFTSDYVYEDNKQRLHLGKGICQREDVRVSYLDEDEKTIPKIKGLISDFLNRYNKGECENKYKVFGWKIYRSRELPNELVVKVAELNVRKDDDNVESKIGA